MIIENLFIKLTYRPLNTVDLAGFRNKDRFVAVFSLKNCV